MGTIDLCRVCPGAVRHERARQNSGRGPCGDCRRALWVLGPRGRHVAKRNVKLQVWDLVRIVGIVAPFATRGVGIRGKFVLSSPMG